MGWLSLITTVTPKLFRSTAKATSTLWKGGKAVTSAGWGAVNTAVKNPKTTAVAVGAAYAGWYKLDHPDESFGTAVGKTVKDSVEASGGFVHDAINGFTGKDTVEGIKETTSDVVASLKESKGLLGTLGDSLKGLSDFLGNLFGGGGLHMFGNFFRNLGSGNISGLSIGALIAAAYFIFGRSGILSKIGGMLLAMMMIGSNSREHGMPLAQAPSQQETETQQHGMHR